MSIESPVSSFSDRPKMASIEAARALAAFVVVLMHAANLMRVEQFSGHVGLANVFDFGYVGVDFFFVLSGFIITYVHYAEIGHPRMIGRYLWRRFSRIFPIYWFVLSLVILVTSAVRLVIGKPLEFDIGVQDIAGTVFLIADGTEPKYVGVAWSLQYELMFYLAFCTLLVHARFGVMVFFVWGCYVILKVVGCEGPALPYLLSNPHCFQFLIGVCVGGLVRRFDLRNGKSLMYLAIFSFILATLFDVYGPYERHSGIGRIALGIAAGFVLTALVGLERHRQPKIPDWLVRMGAVSYTIYLGHILFLNITYMVLLKLGLYHFLPEVIVYFSAVIVALVATVFLGKYIELPMVNGLKNFFKAA